MTIKTISKKAKPLILSDDPRWSRFPSAHSSSAPPDSDTELDHGPPEDTTLRDPQLAHVLRGIEAEEGDPDSATEESDSGMPHHVGRMKGGKGVKRKRGAEDSEEESEADTDESGDSEEEVMDTVFPGPVARAKQGPLSRSPVEGKIASLSKTALTTNTPPAHPYVKPKMKGRYSKGSDTTTPTSSSLPSRSTAAQPQKKSPKPPKISPFQHAAALAEQRRKDKEAGIEAARLARIEREAAREAAYHRRKQDRNFVMRKTKRGQPVLGNMVQKMLGKIRQGI
ncbi:hypothetical protein HDU93_007710 [Gonapodya sp. JEL0774]|nr:hypothetical protein HDU93_007710 [Gonapodya sp. JEL0774]